MTAVKERKPVEEKRETLTNKLEGLTISNNFIFTKTMEDKEIAREFVSKILGKDIGDIEVTETEKRLDTRYESKSVRLDVYLKSKNEVINVEMQVVDDPDLALRARNYQSIMDQDSSVKGMQYNELPESYIIFICMYDAVGSGEATHHFVCYDIEKNWRFNTKTHIILLNSLKADLCESEEVKEILKYVNDSEKSDSEFIDKLDKRVFEVKHNKLWEKEYMFYNAEIAKSRKDGIAEEKESIVKSLFENGQSIEYIAKIVKLTEEEVKEILK